MGVVFDGGVVLGADSRTSTGSYVANRVSDKIVPLSDFIWSCRSGSASDTQAVADYTSNYLEGHRYILELALVCIIGY
jgi:20S proteasome subunit beta 1